MRKEALNTQLTCITIPSWDVLGIPPPHMHTLKFYIVLMDLHIEGGESLDIFKLHDSIQFAIWKALENVKNTGKSRQHRSHITQAVWFQNTSSVICCFPALWSAFPALEFILMHFQRRRIEHLFLMRGEKPLKLLQTWRCSKQMNYTKLLNLSLPTSFLQRFMKGLQYLCWL